MRLWGTWRDFEGKQWTYVAESTFGLPTPTTIRHMNSDLFTTTILTTCSSILITAVDSEFFPYFTGGLWTEGIKNSRRNGAHWILEMYNIMTRVGGGSAAAVQCVWLFFFLTKFMCFRDEYIPDTW